MGFVQMAVACDEARGPRLAEVARLRSAVARALKEQPRDLRAARIELNRIARFVRVAPVERMAVADNMIRDVIKRFLDRAKRSRT